MESQIPHPQRARIVVAFMLPAQAAAKPNAFRRRFDPRTADAIGAHLTLAGPVNTLEPLDAIARRVEEVAAESGIKRADLQMRLSRVGSFLPASSTVFFEVHPTAGIAQLHKRLIERLCWEEPFSYHPHVTICEYLPAASSAEVFTELADERFDISATIDSVTLLLKNADGQWEEMKTIKLAC